MISEAGEYALKELLLLLLMLTANLDILEWASHFSLGLFLHLKTKGIGLDQ